MWLRDWIKLDKQRGLIGAIILYFTSFLFFLLLTMIVVFLSSALGITLRENQVGGLVAAISSLLFAFAILYAKKISPKSLYGVLAVIFAFIAYYNGALIGLIPSAYFSTLKPRLNA